MLKVTLLRVFIVLSILVLNGCATIDDLRPGTGSVLEIKGKTYAQIWKASLKATSNKLTIVYDNKQRGEIRAEAEAKMASWGEVVGVFISPTTPGEKKYTVEVVSMKRYKIQVTGQNWERAILAAITVDLDL